MSSSTFAVALKLHEASTHRFLPSAKIFHGRLQISVLTGDLISKDATFGSIANAFEPADVIVENELYDVAVVGAGPSGLAAGMRASTQGLATLIIEATSPGGHAGANTKIEEYLRFARTPAGVEGSRHAQPTVKPIPRRLALSHAVINLKHLSAVHSLQLDDGTSVFSRAIIAATGARYRRLEIPNYGRFEFHGIHYAATGMEAALCLGEDVAIIGGGNSAGQAAVFLSGLARHVHLLVRSRSLSPNISPYLAERILNSPHITVHTRTEIESLDGDSMLRGVTWRDQESGKREVHALSNLFVMIGANPNSEWLREHLKVDASGFVLTGFAHAGFETSEFATSRPGIFAVGDVRSGSVKRVASAAAEGSVVVADLHRYLGKIEYPPS